MSTARQSDAETPLLQNDLIEKRKQEYGQPARLDLSFLSSLLAILKVLQPYPAVLLSLLSIMELFIIAQVGKITGSYYRILLDKDWGAFWHLTWISCLLYAAATFTSSTTLWLSEFLAIRWRAVLTTSLQGQYLAGRAFYKLQGQVDNLDQRIVQDVAQFCSLVGEIAAKLAASPFKVVFYSVWMGSLTSWPALLAVYSFFCIGACIQRLVMSPIAGIVALQERLEGDLRYTHMRVRMLAEEIALSRGNQAELVAMQQQLEAAVSNAQHLVMWRWLLSTVTSALDYSGAILNFLCVALPIASGRLPDDGDSGKTAQRISNASFATLSLIYSFTECLNLADDLATLAGLTNRVSVAQKAMLASVVDTQAEKPQGTLSSETLSSEKSMTQAVPLLSSEDFTCKIGGRLAIVESLSLTLLPGDHFILLGCSGSGKSTLLRALAGLWPYTAQSLSLTPKVMFLPQRAIVAPGRSLREQLTYPSSNVAGLETLFISLRTVQLEYLLQRVDGDWERGHDWQGELSEGELQRIAIARVLYQRPLLAFLDEPFSAMSESLGLAMFKAITDVGTTIFMTGQDDSPYAKEQRKPDYHKLVPLVYAPALPLLRIALNKRVKPGTRDVIFAAALLTALAHAGYVMSGDSTM